MDLKISNTLRRTLSVPKSREKTSKTDVIRKSYFMTLSRKPTKLTHIHEVFKFSTTSQAIKWISSNPECNGIANSKGFIQYTLEIEEKVDKNLFEMLFKKFFGIEHSILISVESLEVSHETLFYWRNLGKQMFHSLEINNDSDRIVSQYCQKFLKEEILNSKSGILKNFKNKPNIGVHELGDEENNNLLIYACRQYDHVLVQKLLEFKFYVDFENNENLSAVEYAWKCYKDTNNEDEKQHSNQIILNLFNHNAKYPQSMVEEFEKSSEEVKEFIEYCESIHNDVENDDITKIKSKIEQRKHLYYFYNRYNESLTAYTLRCKKPQIYNNLLKLELSYGDHEEPEDIYDEKDTTYCILIRNETKLYAKVKPKRHLSILESKSKVGPNDRESDTKWKHINEAFRIIDENVAGSKILKVVSMWKKTEIIFDFKQESVIYLDPTKSKYTLGAAYNSGTIYVGAKYLIDDDKKYEVIGVIIHEFCHLAVLITFMNTFDPYPMGDSKEKEMFKEVYKECKKNQVHNSFIENVFKNYINDHHESELIVTVVQMMMHYYIKDPKVDCENSIKMKETENMFGLLFDYFKTVVEPEFEEAMEVLEILQSERCNIKFIKLTNPMKARILHSKIDFQGKDSTFFDLVGNDNDILSSLTAVNIQDILLNRKKYTLNKICKSSEKYKIMERRFVNCNVDLWYGSNIIYAEETENYESVIKLAEEKKIFILSDNAGAGKTTTLEHLSLKLKSEYPSFWVSFLHLRSHRNTLDKYKDTNFKNDGIFKLLNKLLNLNVEIEKKIFKKLFLDQKVILLFDGIDEISPRFNEFILNMFHELKKISNIQIWISTRPQHAQELMESFKAPAYKLVPYCWEEKKDFILDVLKVFKITNTSEQSTALERFQIFFKTVEYREKIDNPLMIKIIAELYAEDKISLKSESFNLYDTFDKIIETQKETFYSKLENKEHFAKLNKVSVSLDEIHQKYALEVILPEESQHRYGIKYDDLTLIKNWNEREKRSNKYIDLEEIQRYGILSITSKDNKLNIDFIHRTYPEFFVAQFLASFLYSKAEYSEFDKVLNFIIKSLNNCDELKNVREFLLCRIKQEKKYVVDQKVVSFVSSMSKNIRNEILKLFRPQSLEFSSSLLSSSNEFKTLNKLWLVGSSNNLLKKILCGSKLKSEEFRLIFENLNRYFGKNWHISFSSGNVILIRSESLNDFDIKKGFNEFNKNLLKVLDLIDKTYSKKEKKKVLNNFLKDIVLEFFDVMHAKIFEKIHTTFEFKNGEIMHLLIDMLATSEYISQKWIEIITLDCFKSEFDKLSILEKEELKLLYVNANFKNSILFVALTSDKVGIFKKITNLCYKIGNSNEKLQNLLLKDLPISTILLSMKEIHFEDFVEFINFIFEKDISKLIASIKVEKTKNELVQNYEKFELFKKFLLRLLNNDREHVELVTSDYVYQLNYADMLLEALKSNELAEFHQIINICLEFNKNSLEDLQNLFKVQQKLHEYFIFMTIPFFNVFRDFMKNIFANNRVRIFSYLSENFERNLSFVLNEDKFEMFEHFIIFIFNDNKSEASKLLYEFFSMKLVEFEHPLVNSIRLDNLKMFTRLKTLFMKYHDQHFYKEMREAFTLRNIIPNLILSASEDFCCELLEFLKEVFNNDKRCLLIYLEDWVFKKEIDLLLDEKYFLFFKEIFVYLYNDDNFQAITHLKSLLVINENTFIEVLKGSLSKEKYKNILWIQNLLEILNYSSKTLQSIFISLRNILESFVKLPTDSLKILTKCLNETFSSNKDRFPNCMESNSKVASELISKKKRFDMFENLLINLFDDDKNEVEKIVRSLLFEDYSYNSHPLIKAMKSDDFVTLEEITSTYVKYDKLYINIQKVIISNYNIFDIYIGMTCEMKKMLVDFMKKIFDSNRSDLKEYFNNLPKSIKVNIIINEDKFKNFQTFIQNILFENNTECEEYSREELFCFDDEVNSKVLLVALQSENFEILKWIIMYFKTYKRKLDIQIAFVKEKIFPDIFYYLNDEILNELLSFFDEVFKEDKNKIVNCFQENCNENFKLIIHQRTFCQFENFIRKIYENDEFAVESIIKKYLLFDYTHEFHPLVIAIKSNCIYNFRRISVIYNKFKHLIIDFSDFLPSSCNRTDRNLEIDEIDFSIYEDVVDFFKKIFKSIMSKQDIVNYIKYKKFESTQFNILIEFLNSVISNRNQIAEILEEVFDDFYCN